jgi:hypothetical protein
MEKVKTKKPIQYIDIEVQIKKETEKAILVGIGDLNFWVPISQLKNRKKNEGDTHDITIPKWIAKKNGLTI